MTQNDPCPCPGDGEHCPHCGQVTPREHWARCHRVERNILLEQSKGDVAVVNLRLYRARLLMITLGATAEEADDLLTRAGIANGYITSGHFKISQRDGRFDLKYRHQPYYGEHAPKNRPDQKAVNAHYRWWRSHLQKKPLPTRRAAWRRVLRLQLRDRRPDFGLRPYACTFGSWPDKTAPLHYHVGHGKRLSRRSRRRLACRVRKLTIYPYYRARSRYRQWRKEHG